MVLKVGYSIFFLILNFVIHLKLNNKNISKNYLGLILFGFILIASNFYFEVLPNNLFYFLFIFSLSIFIMKYFSKSANVLKNSELTNDKKVIAFKEIIFNKIFPIMITIFQIVSIWFDKTMNSI